MGGLGRTGKEVKMKYLLIIFCAIGFVFGQADDTIVPVHDYINVKGGVERGVYQIQPNNGKWQKSKKHIYYLDTVYCTFTIHHRSSYGLGKDTIIKYKALYIKDQKSDSLPTGDSLGGKPCSATTIMRAANGIFGEIHDTDVVKR
jgi:hypothetical protein